MKFVAFLDVLGFKAMVENVNHEKLRRVYENFLSNVASALSNGKFKIVESPSGQVAIADLAAPLSSSITVSDSVIFWTEDTSMKSFISICAATRNLIVLGIYTGLPMRGGIAMGDLSHLKSAPNSPEAFGFQTVFGKGLVRAYEDESVHEWMGCVISDECVAAYEDICTLHAGQDEELATLDYLISAGFIVRYPAPRKSGDSVQRWVINWPKGNPAGIPIDIVESSFTMHNKTLGTMSASAKLDNTLKFLKASQQCSTVVL